MPVPRAPLPADTYTATFDRLEAEANRRVAYMQRATPEVADTLGRVFEKHGSWLPTDALVALILGGASEAVVDQAAGKAGAAKVKAGVPDVEPVPRKKRPWWQAAGDIAYDALKTTTRSATTALAAPLQAVTTSLANAYQGQSSLVEALTPIDMPGEQHPDQIGRSLTQFVTGGWVDPAQPFDNLRSTTLAAMIGGNSPGTGFFPGGAAEEAQAGAARKFRGEVTPGHAWTVGRLYSTSMQQYTPGAYDVLNSALRLAMRPMWGPDPLHVGDQPDLVSGVIDATVAMTADPVQHMPVKAITQADKAATAASKADQAVAYARGWDELGDVAKAAAWEQIAAEQAKVTKAATTADPAWASIVEQNAGLISGPTRKTILPPRALKWLYSDQARAVVVAAREETSGYRLWRAFDRKLPIQVAFDLARAGDDQTVIRVLGEALSTGGVRELPKAGKWSGDIGRLGVRVTNTMQDKARIFGSAMQDAWVDFHDPDSAIRNLDNALGNVRILRDDRAKLIDNFIEAAIAGGPGDQKAALETINAAVAQQLVKYGMSAEDARTLTRFTGDIDRLQAWMINDIGRNIPLYMDPDGVTYGPHRIVELFNRGGFVYDRSAARGVRAQTSVWRHVLGDPGIGAIGQSPTLRRFPLVAIDAIQTNIWKPLTLVRAAYLAKVLPEEVVRTTAGGHFEHIADFLLAHADHGYASDVRGVMFDRAGTIKNLNRQLDEAIRAGQPTGDLLKQMDDALGEAMDSYREALAGRVRGQNTKYLDDQAMFDRMVRRGQAVIVDRLADPEKYVRGWGDELVKLSMDPVGRRVARGSLRVEDHLAYLGVGQKRWATVLAAAGGDEQAALATLYASSAKPPLRPGLDGIADWLHATPEGQAQLDKIMSSYPQYDWADPVTVDRWVAQYADDVALHTGSDAELLDAVATGTFRGDRVGEYNKMSGKHYANKELRAHLRGLATDDTSPIPPAKMRYTPTAREAARGGDDAMAQALAAKDRIVTWFFSSIYGKSSDYLSRSPEFRAAYWHRVEELGATLTRDEAAKALANAEKAGLPKQVLARLRHRLETASGTNRLTHVDELAKGYALDDVQRLLYDASQKSQFFDVNRILFPFGEAWREITTTWMKMLTKNPRVLNTTHKVITGAQDSGFFHRDPTTGQEVFTVPLSAQAARLITGPLMNAMPDYQLPVVGNLHSDGPGLGVPMTGEVRGLSIGGGIIPGLGPAAGFLVGQLMPDVPQMDFVNQFLFPYGEPDSPNPIKVPPWLDKTLTLWKAWGDKSKVYMNTYADVLKAKAASGEYDQTPDDQERLLADAANSARLLTVMRGLVQFGSPSAPSPEWIAATKEGDRVAALLTEDFRTMQAEDYQTAPERFLAKYGDYAAYYMASKTKSTVGGLDATDAFGDWERTHGQFLEQFKETGSYFGPQDPGNFDMTVYSRQLREGKRTRQTPRQIVEDANRIVAQMIYNRATDKLPEDESKWTDEQRAWRAGIRDGLIELYPGFNPTAAGQMSQAKRTVRIAELEKAANDPTMADNATAEAVRVWFAAREKASQAAVAAGFQPSSWATAKALAGTRTWMRQIGSALVSATPSFGRVYDELLSREMKDDPTVEVPNG